MRLAEIIAVFENVAPSFLQEDYDNSGLIVGNAQMEVKKALLCLDSTEEVVDEAISNGCGLIIAHHPIIFKGLKRLNGKNYVERAVIKAIQNNIAIYACHTNLDNVLHQGVNEKIAEKLGLTDTRILKSKAGNLQKLVVYVPTEHAENLRKVLFSAGAGHVGNYDECSFNAHGEGTFRGNENSNPFIGIPGERHHENETRIETIVPVHLAAAIIGAMKAAHPYEEVAYDLYDLQNEWPQTGSGLLGFLDKPIPVSDFPAFLKEKMQAEVVRYSGSRQEPIEKVAICGGAGSFLVKDAMIAGADAFVTADVKYHEFFDAENGLMLCDIGHFESEKYTIELFSAILSEKFPNFATIFSRAGVNPVNYYY
jgi:dinuclear metal center YbgI/SA1388 family protein